jgi:hypothetical protein
MVNGTLPAPRSRSYTYGGRALRPASNLPFPIRLSGSRVRVLYYWRPSLSLCGCAAAASATAPRRCLRSHPGSSLHQRPRSNPHRHPRMSVRRPHRTRVVVGVLDLHVRRLLPVDVQIRNEKSTGMQCAQGGSDDEYMGLLDERSQHSITS